MTQCSQKHYGLMGRDQKFSRVSRATKGYKTLLNSKDALKQSLYIISI